MISANILELLGAFFLGAVVATATLWTLVCVAATEATDDDGDDDESGGETAKAGA